MSAPEPRWTHAVGSLVTAPERYGSTVFEITDQVVDEDDGEPFYYADADGYVGQHFTDADLKAFLSAEDAAKRRLPTPTEFAAEYGWLSSSTDAFDLTESAPDGSGRVEVVGRTHDGLRFVALLQVVDIQPAEY